jgi:flagellar hook-associated protein 2
MNIRFMAQNQLMSSGFNFRSSSAPPAWQNNASAQQNNDIASNASIRSAGRNIQDAFSGSQQGRQSSFNMLQGVSSDSDVATVSVNNARVISSLPPQNASLNVQQMATAQVNEGAALDRNDRDVNPGTFSFSIQTGGRTHNFTMRVEAFEDNEAVQRRMAETINARGIGVTASVATEGTGQNATSSLTLTGDQTGAGNAFTVRDTSGNLAETMGVTDATQEAQNAIYSVNGGVVRESASNEINLGRGVTATLQGEGTTDISFTRNAQQAIEAATSLVNALNSALRNTNTNDGRGSERFVSDIQGMNRTFASALSRVGINVQADGQLSIDSARMERAAADGSLSRMFDNDRNFGFAGRAERIANNAASGSYRNAPNPVNFTSPNNQFNFGNVDNFSSLLNLFA